MGWAFPWLRLTLARLTMIVWLAWLATLVIMASLSYARVLHPSYLYMAIPLAVQVLGTLAVLGGGMWRVIRGPRRWRAATWMLLGTLPALWMAAYIEYVVMVAVGRNHPANLLLRSAVAACSLIGEPYARVRYPYRHEGQRFVMWSDSPQPVDQQMASMDAHIRAIEQALGRRSEYKVYWIRGPVWGFDGRYVQGWSLGSLSTWPADEGDGLNYMDRHEVAHFTLDQLLPRDLETPMVLVEGWAEFHSGRHAEWAWRQAWRAQQEGKWLSLRELTSPRWYHNSNGPAYWQGYVLVDYLLRRFGHERFLELCRTCRQATFPEDVQRVLGLSVDELDRAYRQDLAGQESPDKRFLLSAKLGDGVDPSEWRRFVDDYCAGVKRLRSPFRQSSLTRVQDLQSIDKDGGEKNHHSRFEYSFDHQRVARTQYYQDSTNVHAATPGYHFSLHKGTADISWRLVNYYARDPQSDYDFGTGSSEVPDFLETSLGPLQSQDYLTGLKITGIVDSAPNSHRVRVSYERALNVEGHTSRERGWWDLDPDRNYGVVEAQCEYLDKSGAVVRPEHRTVEYEAIEGNQVPTRARCESHLSNGGSFTITEKIESCRFGPPPAKVFELATYGNWPPPQSASKPSEQSLILPWIAGACSLLALLMVGGRMVFSRLATGH